MSSAGRKRAAAALGRPEQGRAPLGGWFAVLGEAGAVTTGASARPPRSAARSKAALPLGDGSPYPAKQGPSRRAQARGRRARPPGARPRSPWGMVRRTRRSRGRHDWRKRAAAALGRPEQGRAPLGGWFAVPGEAGAVMTGASARPPRSAAPEQGRAPP